MTLRIQKSADDEFVIFTLSGRIEFEHLRQLQSIFENETEGKRIELDLTEVRLVDRETVRFLADCEEDGVRLENCPAYIREWIKKEKSTESK